MKRPKESPSDDEIMQHNNVPIQTAAKYVGWSTATLYRALQEERAPFGMAVKCESGSWAYNISPGLLVKYKRGDLPTYRLREVQELAADGIARLLDEKLGALRRVVDAIA